MVLGYCRLLRLQRIAVPPTSEPPSSRLGAAAHLGAGFGFGGAGALGFTLVVQLLALGHRHWRLMRPPLR